MRKVIAGKKLVMIVYFAPWCGNWKYEAPIAAKLYEKYKAQGFQVIGVSEYAPATDTFTSLAQKDPPYPVFTESESRDDKQKTAHYGYRQLTGDTRNWGSPWNIFLEPDKLNADWRSADGKGVGCERRVDRRGSRQVYRVKTRRHRHPPL